LFMMAIQREVASSAMGNNQLAQAAAHRPTHTRMTG
jgi:hypothetical protein